MSGEGAGRRQRESSRRKVFGRGWRWPGCTRLSRISGQNCSRAALLWGREQTAASAATWHPSQRCTQYHTNVTPYNHESTRKYTSCPRKYTSCTRKYTSCAPHLGVVVQQRLLQRLAVVVVGLALVGQLRVGRGILPLYGRGNQACEAASQKAGVRGGKSGRWGARQQVSRAAMARTAIVL